MGTGLFTANHMEQIKKKLSKKLKVSSMFTMPPVCTAIVSLYLYLYPCTCICIHCVSFSAPLCIVIGVEGG